MADGGIRCNLSKPHGSGPAQWLLRKCWLLLLFPIWKCFREKEDFFGGWWWWRLWYIAVCGSFSSPEKTTTFLYDSDALFAGFVQIGRNLVDFPQGLVEVCAYTSGWGVGPNDCSEVPGCDSVWRDNRFFLYWCARQASASISDPWDCDHQGALIFSGTTSRLPH